MLGFIKKDLLMIKGNLKFLVILLLVYVFLGFQGEMNLSFVLPAMSVMIMISTFSYDAYNKWDAYACSLPNGRENSVKAKYLATIILVMITTIIITILSIVISYVQMKGFNFEKLLFTILESVLVTTLLQSFMYPSIYKFGVEKARIGIFITILGIAMIGAIMEKLVDFNVIIKNLDMLGNHLIIIILIFMIIILYLSYKISKEIYKKKEY